ncbi:MAG TPA: Asp-tRNA(Asn)/Glu-tRNA(Gln) amidotransferase subunit GatB [Actinomycetota bacterium]|nr:Asp-tRNA(Asn)/Glu-tRNA(Gln) amidotransferase subunit GatB [Actinomycetota bacterium]
MSRYETVIGLECHVELSTRTKMFCSCENRFGGEPNTRVCEICLGHPGTLPVANRRAVEYTMKIGLALDSEIAPRSLFHRKNYFYPDMPKNYQISQYDLPVATGGHLDIEVDGDVRRIGMTRVHLEEDTGKTIHQSATGRIAEATSALEDYNRAGVPLVEVVSEPDIRSPEEARAYLLELRALLESLGVSDVRMEEGSLRCDANVSVRREGEELGTKVEIKNMNSIRSVERALRFEAQRQREALDAGEALVQETRHWDEDQGVTLPLRSKEYAFDYRYFPDPDLEPIEPDQEWIDRLRAELPELPAARRRRYREELDVPAPTARLLAESKEWSGFFDEAVALGAEPRAAANWMTGDLAGLLREEGRALEEAPVKPRHVADLVRLVADGTISSRGAKDALEEAFRSGRGIEEIVAERGLAQISDEAALGTVVDEVIAENPGPAEQFRGGKEGVIGFLLGQVMKKTRGAANPQEAQRLLRERLSG